MLSLKNSSVACAVIAAAVLAGCGSSSGSSTAGSGSGGSGSAPAAGSPSPSSTSGTSGTAALSADARSAATGDIPDNQLFLLFTNRAAAYSLKYPEGWTQSGAAHNVTFRDKNNLVHVVIGSGAAPTPESLTAELTRLKSSNPTLTFQPPHRVTLGSTSALKVVYTTLSAPNPVTGKRVLLIVDRYELSRGGHVATVDLGTPKGVDNVDAYRMMIESFRWR